MIKKHKKSGFSGHCFRPSPLKCTRVHFFMLFFCTLPLNQMLTNFRRKKMLHFFLKTIHKEANNKKRLLYNLKILLSATINLNLRNINIIILELLLNIWRQLLALLDISLQNQHQMTLLRMCINIFACIYTNIYYLNII